jgi:hypothetical protein
MPLANNAEFDRLGVEGNAHRFYHGFIHDILSVAASNGDISGIFDVLNQIKADVPSKLSSEQWADFSEAFGAVRPSQSTAATDSTQKKQVPVINGAASPGHPTGNSPSANMAAAASTTAQSKAVRNVHGTASGTSQTIINFDERSKLYSLYNWELGVHACMSLIDSLLKSQQFQQARDVCHYIFDPFASGDKNDPSRYWKFPPFKVASVATIESLFLELEAGQSDSAINDWRNRPFSPYVVARNRPEAYMKWIVMAYIKILIGWGDSLFSQNTLESIPQAIQMYVMASHIYGPRGQVTPQRPVAPQTFRSLSKKFDAFSNAMVQLEVVFPFSNQTSLPLGKLPLDEDDHLPNIFGFAGTLYFAIPDNPSIRALAATIDDRLTKIRNSEDINGNFRVLPLLAPPIDPALLVKAQAQGLSLSSVLQDLQGPLPNSRFETLMQKALEIVAEVKSLSQSLISIRERRDGESLMLMKQRQELSLQNALMPGKTLALHDAQNAVAVLKYNRVAAVSRLSFWFKMIGSDPSGIPVTDQDFQELDAKIAAPNTSGGLALSDYEQSNMNQTGDANELTSTVNTMEVAIAAMRIIPDCQVNTQPLGCGLSMTLGSTAATAAYEAVARGLTQKSQVLQGQAGVASTLGGHQRALQERILQANTAGYEISNIDKQITGAQLRSSLAQKEIEIVQQQVNDSQQLTDYLSSKYSSVDLYTWLDGQTRSLSYQIYTAAFGLAQRAEKAFHYERPQTASTTFVNSGYWDNTRDGLFAAENLYLSLKQLETAYLDTRGHDYEITKTISLRSLNPLALMQLRERCTCDFTLDEILFDIDFPGHYLRRLKSVALTIPCVVGPNTSVNGTLRLLSSEYRISAAPAPSYQKDTTTSPNGTDSRFALAAPPLSAIAVSSASADAGVFTLDFSGSASQRYMPFEGAGAISTWRLELPSKVRQFNYDSIFDVVLQLKYTSLEGGLQLQTAANTAVDSYLARQQQYAADAGFSAMLDLKAEYASEWAKAVGGAGSGSASGNSGVDAPVAVQLNDIRPRLPFFTVGKSVNVTKVHLLVDKKLSGKLTVSVGSADDAGGSSAPPPLEFGGDIGDVAPLLHFAVEAGNKGVPFGKSWIVTLGSRSAVQALTKCVMLVEYVITGNA